MFSLLGLGLQVSDSPIFVCQLALTVIVHKGSTSCPESNFPGNTGNNLYQRIKVGVIVGVGILAKKNIGFIYVLRGNSIEKRGVCIHFEFMKQLKT